MYVPSGQHAGGEGGEDAVSVPNLAQVAECFQGAFLARLMPPVKKELKALAASAAVTSVQLARLGADEGGLLSGGGAKIGGGGGGKEEEDAGGEGGPAGAKGDKARLFLLACPVKHMHMVDASIIEAPACYIPPVHEHRLLVCH